MSLILQFDTSTSKAFVSVAKDGVPLCSISNDIQKEHASFLHQAVADVLEQASVNIHDIDAFAIVHGPGSYTGLRVGMAAAKGFCYALQKPFITVSGLEVMAWSVLSNGRNYSSGLFCPMIDARRMEVFTASYNHRLELISKPHANILTPDSFDSELENQPVYFFGDGAAKFESILNHPNAHFVQTGDMPAALGHLAQKIFLEGRFTDLAHSEPLYVKEFQST